MRKVSSVRLVKESLQTHFDFFDMEASPSVSIAGPKIIFEQKDSRWNFLLHSTGIWRNNQGSLLFFRQLNENLMLFLVTKG